MKRSQSDSRLYREKEEGENGLISNEVFGSTSSLHGTYVKTPAVLPADWQKGYDSSSNELGRSLQKIISLVWSPSSLIYVKKVVDRAWGRG